MAQRSGVSFVQRFEALPIIIVFVLLLALFMNRAPEVFLAPYIYTTFLSTLPPLILLAAGLTFVIGAGEIDLCFPSIIAFSGFVFAVLFKEYELGWFAVIAGLASGVLVGFINGAPHRQGRHSVLHDHAGDPVLLGRHGDRAVGRQVLCIARRRGELGLAMDRRSAIRIGERRLAAASVDPGAMDGDHRRLPLARPHPPPLRRAHARSSATRTTSRASSASTSTARRSRSSP